MPEFSAQKNSINFPRGTCVRGKWMATLNAPSKREEVINVKAYKKPTITSVNRKAVMRGDA